MTQYVRPKCSSRHAKLWWLCTSCVDAGAEDLEHLVDHGVATGVRVLAGELHRRDVRLAELGVDLEEHRRRVHLALVGAIAEAQALREREEPDAVRWPKPRDPKWTPTQIRPSSSSMRLT